jgi:hypothetical protein
VWKKTGEMVIAAMEGEEIPAARVPCGSCRECCWHGRVDVYPGMDEMEHLDAERDDDGKYWLRKREDGACVHLGDKGCTIYAHRPRSCRAYDCRLYALTGVLDSFDNGHHQPAWVFQPESLESRALEGACGILGKIVFAQARRAGEGISARDVAVAVTTHPKLEQTIGAVLTLLKCTPEQQKEVLGFDPATVTAEQMRASYRAFVGEPNE